MVCIGKADLFQHLYKEIPFSVKICHTIDHPSTPFRTEWSNCILPQTSGVYKEIGKGVPEGAAIPMFCDK